MNICYLQNKYEELKSEAKILFPSPYPLCFSFQNTARTFSKNRCAFISEPLRFYSRIAAVLF